MEQARGRGDTGAESHTYARARANERTDDNGNDEVAVDIEEVLGEVARNKDADEDEKGSGEKLDE